MPGFNQPSATAQSAFEPTDSPKKNPTTMPEVDTKAKPTYDRRDQALPASSPKRRSRPPARTRVRSSGPPKMVQSPDFSSGERTDDDRGSPGGNIFRQDDKKRPFGGSGQPGGGGGDEPPPPDKRMKKRGKNHHSKIMVMLTMNLLMMKTGRTTGMSDGKKAKKKSRTQAVKIVPSRATMRRIEDLKNG